jgi:Amt family ammonium transporter
LRTSQTIGIVSVGIFVMLTSAIVWLVLKYTVGVRVDEEAEVNGLDQSELGLEAYPEFGRGSQTV